MTKLRYWMIPATLTWLWACGGSPEQSALDQFFRAAQTSDHTTVANISAAAPPVEAQSWKVVEVTSRTREPFAMPELREQFQAAEKERNAGQEARKEYYAEHQEALDEIIPKLREDPDYEFKGELGEVQEEWMKMQEERRETERIYQEARRALDEETRLATRSVVRQVPLHDFEGEVEVSEVVVNLTPRESTAELPFKATLRRYEVTDPEVGRVEPARWVIVDFEGMTEEARAAAAAEPEEERAAAREPAPEAAEPAQAPSVAPTEASMAAPAPKAPAAREPAAQEPAEESDPGYLPKELRGLAKVQILAPETQVTGDQVITTIRARNISKDWITRFTATEHWYDQQGNAVRSTSRTHQGRFMPGDVIELELRTPKGENFYQNQFEFSHANGQVSAVVVQSLPGT